MARDAVKSGSSLQTKPLHGRVALITGGTSTVGLAIAKELAKAGANIALGSSIRDDSGGRRELHHTLGTLPSLEQLEDAAKSLENYGVHTLAMAVDVTSLESVLDFYAAIERKFEHVDILVNAATASGEQALCGHSDELWNGILEVNLNGPYRLAKLCLPGMLQRGWGHVINLQPKEILNHGREHAAVFVSRAALIALSECIGHEGSDHGVSSHIVAPGSDLDTLLKRIIGSARPEDSQAGPQAGQVGPSEGPDHRGYSV